MKINCITHSQIQNLKKNKWFIGNAVNIAIVNRYCGIVESIYTFESFFFLDSYFKTTFVDMKMKISHYRLNESFTLSCLL